MTQPVYPSRLKTLPSMAVAGLLAAVSAAPAAAEPLSTRYDVSLIGLPVGRASFDTTIAGNSYIVEGTLASSGLADIVTKIKGKSRVAGRIRGTKLFADSYGLDYSSDKKTYRSAVTFRTGKVASADVAPKVTKPKTDYVPVSPTQLNSVVDPLSGLMLKGKATPESLCQRRLPFFDGWSRLDLVMSPAGTKPFSTNGYKGDVVVCNVKIEPVSGYRAASRGMKFIQRQTIELWFAEIKNTGIFAPVYAKIPTEIGPLTLRASVFAKN